MGVTHGPMASKPAQRDSVEIAAATLEAHLAAISRHIESPTKRTTERVQASCRALKELLDPVTRVSQADAFIQHLDSPEWQEFLDGANKPVPAGPTATNLAHTPWAPIS